MWLLIKRLVHFFHIFLRTWWSLGMHLHLTWLPLLIANKKEKIDQFMDILKVFEAKRTFLVSKLRSNQKGNLLFLDPWVCFVPGLMSLKSELKEPFELDLRIQFRNTYSLWFYTLHLEKSISWISWLLWIYPLCIMGIYEKVLKLLSKPVPRRGRVEVAFVETWFRQKSKLLNKINRGKKYLKILNFYPFSYLDWLHQIRATFVTKAHLRDSYKRNVCNEFWYITES